MSHRTVTATVHFEIEYSPDAHEHYMQVARNYFQGKGVALTPPERNSNNELYPGPIWIEICDTIEWVPKDCAWGNLRQEV